VVTARCDSWAIRVFPSSRRRHARSERPGSPAGQAAPEEPESHTAIRRLSARLRPCRPCLDRKLDDSRYRPQATSSMICRRPARFAACAFTPRSPCERRPVEGTFSSFRFRKRRMSPLPSVAQALDNGRRRRCPRTVTPVADRLARPTT